MDLNLGVGMTICRFTVYTLKSNLGIYPFSVEQTAGNTHNAPLSDLLVDCVSHEFRDLGVTLITCRPETYASETSFFLI